MLKMQYFNLRLLLGVLRSKQVSGRCQHHSVYSVNLLDSFNLSTRGGVLPPGGRHAPGYPTTYFTPCCPTICHYDILFQGCPWPIVDVINILHSRAPRSSFPRHRLYLLFLHACANNAIFLLDDLTIFRVLIEVYPACSSLSFSPSNLSASSFSSTKLQMLLIFFHAFCFVCNHWPHTYTVSIFLRSALTSVLSY